MKKYLLLAIFLSSLCFGNSVLIIKKGWQLIGVNQNIENMSIFKSENVDVVWHFDASSQKWLGYATDENLQKKIANLGIAKLEKLKNWHGFWVKSKKEWSFILEDKKIDTNNQLLEAKIELKKGWNLISMPIDKVISPRIFKGMAVWRYNSKKWEFFNKKDVKTPFARLSHINNSDGIWVKSNEDKNISITNEMAKLQNFDSKEQMEIFIKELATLNNRPFCGIKLLIEPMPVLDTLYAPVSVNSETTKSFDSANGVENATQTNLQESDVDEADIIKHNGKNIFYLVKSKDGDKINITTFSQLINKTKPLNEIVLKDHKVNSLYLMDDKLVVLSNWQKRDEKPLPLEEGIKTDERMIMPYKPVVRKLVVQVFDVSDIQNIKMLSSFKIDGDILTSRMVGQNLYLISTFHPKITVTYPKIYVDMPECKDFKYDYPLNKEERRLYYKCSSYNSQNGKFYRYDYENPITKIIKLTPKIQQNSSAEEDLLNHSSFYASSQKKQNPQITTISKFSINSTPSFEKSSSIIGYTNGHYASSKSFYLVSNQYPIYFDFRNYKHRSTIYKFNLNGELKYSGYGFVNGKILNQFSLSEYQNILRIATTQGFSWSSDGTKNQIYNLKEVNSLLEIQSVLSGLGKKNEVIKAVRFMGNRAYVVTFRQTDPLYTIDLTDPKNPKKMGELQVSGYSAYLHPIGENQILGIGREADEEGRLRGLKVELFDVSDFANPISIDTKNIEGKWLYSELENDHHALAFRDSDNLFAFPYRDWDYQNRVTNNYLGVYQITQNQIKSYPVIKNSNKNQIFSKQRGLIFDFDGKTYITHFVNDDITTTILEQ